MRRETVARAIRHDGGRRRRARRASATSLTVALATAVFLSAELGQPLLVEGEAGVGKTEVAQGAGRSPRGARLIRLQCHEGIDVHHASTTGTTRAS